MRGDEAGKTQSQRDEQPASELKHCAMDHLVDVVDAAVYALKLGVDLVKAAVDLNETAVDLVEPAPNLVETMVDRVEALLEATVGPIHAIHDDRL